MTDYIIAITLIILGGLIVLAGVGGLLVTWQDKVQVRENRRAR